ncbi:sugar ABC transporter permease [Dactylosporangium sp. AC04546]|uniref:carbohydrate ABC transporter permease n=1 Tax=Dactylosporangium sp. AC04546 TaxID=2862460 RepID=UPI001EE11813|nr:sugar ABC transporter permease [Dactylosporangium sp. AC04546]WVK79582.1 sugar ABC transporter permease [Dactylosporangium sp. AC04546]
MTTRSRLAPYLFVGGAAVYLLVFTATPLLRGVLLSFTDTKLLNPRGGEYVGLDNYRDLLVDERFGSSVLTTILYTACTVAGSLLLGTAAAFAINNRFRGRAVVRAVLTMPWAVPSIAVVLVFTWIFNVGDGVANRSLAVLGIGEQGWLIDPDLGLLSVTAVSVWKVFPFIMLVVLAALQSVPAEVRESARVDGADHLTTVKEIVLPHIAPTLRILALLMTIWSLRRFEIIYLLTGGGPVDATNTLVINVYREAFANSDLGRAAALGMLGLCLSLVVTVVYFVVERRSARREAS